jgi:hypothetical protein
MCKSQYYQRWRSFPIIPNETPYEIASNEPTSTEASELLARPVSILEVSGSILHLDTGNPNTCYAVFFSISDDALRLAAL